MELPDPLNNGASLLSQLNVKVSGGQTLAIVPLDNEKMNPFELLLERFFDPVKGTLVRNLFLFYFGLSFIIRRTVSKSCAKNNEHSTVADY